MLLERNSASFFGGFSSALAFSCVDATPSEIFSLTFVFERRGHAFERRDERRANA